MGKPTLQLFPFHLTGISRSEKLLSRQTKNGTSPHGSLMQWLSIWAPTTFQAALDNQPRHSSKMVLLLLPYLSLCYLPPFFRVKKDTWLLYLSSNRGIAPIRTFISTWPVGPWYRVQCASMSRQWSTPQGPTSTTSRWVPLTAGVAMGIQM